MALLIALLAVWRVRCIGAGPDPDTDAYGHYVIARQFLETPRDVHIHWVWLPLYHLLLAAGVAVGATLAHVRYVNAVLSALTPLLLWRALRERSANEFSPSQPSQPSWLAALAACLAAAAPIAIEMGTTAQPETLFTLLLLGTAVLLARGRLGGAAFSLSLLVLLRYEAWAVAAGVALVLGVRRARGVLLSPGALACLLSAPLGIGLWAALRRLGGAPWFDFLRMNQSFAESARQNLALPVRLPLAELARRIDTVPFVVWLLGALFLLGLVPTWRRAGVWFVVLPLSIVAFLTLGWLTRSHLGLSRHWVCLVPFAATAAAYGLAECARWLGKRQRAAQRYAFPALSLLIVGLELRALQQPLREWRERTQSALPDRRDAGRFLRSLPASTLILCDDAAAEVLSELPRWRFVRNYLGRDAAGQIRKQGARELVVLSSSERLHAALSLGELVYGDPAREGLIGLHVPAGG